MRLPSARPCTRGITAFMTFPISFGPVAPTEAIASLIIAVNSSSLIAAGRYAFRISSSLLVWSIKSSRLPLMNSARESSRILTAFMITANTSFSVSSSLFFPLISALRMSDRTIRITSRRSLPASLSFIACFISANSFSFVVIRPASNYLDLRFLAASDFFLRATLGFS